MTLPLELATESDLPAIVELMNAAFRGTDGIRGWSIEADCISGQRTDESLLSEEIAGGALYLLAREDSALKGCVSLEAGTPEKWHMGSLAVRPDAQKTGFGSELLSAAEDYAVKHGARTIEMTVLSVRNALILWYERRGYRRTGELRPFPYGDKRFGTPTRDDLEFMVFEKGLLD